MLKTIAAFLLLPIGCCYGQQQIAFRTPPAALCELVLARPTPEVFVNSNATTLLMAAYENYPSISELAQPRSILAGLAIHTANFSAGIVRHISELIIKDLQTGKQLVIDGLPNPLKASQLTWSPTEKKIAFLQTGDQRVDLYVIDITARKAGCINKKPVHAVFDDVYTWIDDNTLLYKATLQPASQAPRKVQTPVGPAVEESGTATNLIHTTGLKNPLQEQLFSFYTASQIILHHAGLERPVGKTAMYQTFKLSPDKRFLLTQCFTAPLPRQLPYYNFPQRVQVINLQGTLLKEWLGHPEASAGPFIGDNIPNQPGAFEWRADKPATLIWREPLDSGRMNKPVDYHDAVFSLQAPFNGPSKLLFRLPMRLNKLYWGNDSVVLVQESSRTKAIFTLSRYHPLSGTIDKLFEWKSYDRTNAPGIPVQTVKGGIALLQLIDSGRKLLLNSVRSATPSLVSYDLANQRRDTLWKADSTAYEFVVQVLRAAPVSLLTYRIEKEKYGNFYLRSLAARTSQPITSFRNPYTALEGVQQQYITYQRADGIELSGSLYLPKGYQPARDGRLPILLWGYPRRYDAKDKVVQYAGATDWFPEMNYWNSPVIWVTQHFAVLEVNMPIVPVDTMSDANDHYIDQLCMNARAAVDHLYMIGIGDTSRVAVGGHSYGAAMVATLLAHTNIFKAGIAVSGGYNRTATPFGFQDESRSFWQAPQLYYSMSALSHANKIKTPLLLIHGDADEVPGTAVQESENLFKAIQGHGGTVRLVRLPFEGHSLQARENLLHFLWEEDQWLKKYVRGSNQ